VGGHTAVASRCNTSLKAEEREMGLARILGPCVPAVQIEKKTGRWTNPNPLTHVCEAAKWALVNLGSQLSGTHPSDARQMISFLGGRIWAGLERKRTKQMAT
jgi:hypothetical protein